MMLPGFESKPCAWMCLRAVALMVAGIAAPTAAQEPDDFDCLIEPHAVTDVSTREEGVLEELLVDRGDLVEAGQVIARLESEIEEAAVELIRVRTQRDAEVEERKLEIAFTKRQLERAENLYKKNAIPFRDKDAAATDAARAELQLRQTKHQLRVAKLELLRARKQLDLRTIRTPITGVVVQRLLAVGESVENRPIVRIAQVDPLNVEVIMPVTHYGSIDFGMQARVQPKFPGAREVIATVTVIDRVVDAASNTFGVRLELANPDYKIPGGVRCEIELLR